MAFDPTKYLAETTPTLPTKKGFDPSAYLAKQEEQTPSMFESAISELAQTIPRQIEEAGGLKEITKTGAKAGLSVLPMAGTVGGGLLGAYGGPMGAVAGAGAGAVAGESLKQMGEKYFLGEEGPKSSQEYLQSLGEAGLGGAGAEMGGQLVSKGLGFLGEKAGKVYEKSRSGVKQNLKDIQGAAESLGIDLPEAWKTTNIYEQKVEQALGQSPRPLGTAIREKYESFKKGIEKVGAELEALKPEKSPFEAGKEFAEGLTKEVKAAKEPVTELYENINKTLQKVHLDPTVTNRYVGGLKRDPVFKTVDGQAFIDKTTKDLSTLKTVADIKEYRSNLLKNITDATSEIDRIRYEKIYDSLTNLRDASIQNMKNDPFIKQMGKEGAGLVDELHNQLALADAQYATNIRELESIKGVIGMKGAVKSPSQFLRNIEKIPEEKLIETAANTDIKTIQQFQKKYPDLYENAKSAKIAKMVQDATDNSGFNVTRFVKNVDKLQPEVKRLLFDQWQLKMIDITKLLLREAPEKLGPSGTPEGIEYIKGLLSPTGWVSDIGLIGQMKLREMGPTIERGLKSPLIPLTTKGLLAPRSQSQGE